MAIVWGVPNFRIFTVHRIVKLAEFRCLVIWESAEADISDSFLSFLQNLSNFYSWFMQVQ